MTLVTCALAAFQQLGGINAIMFYVRPIVLVFLLKPRVRGWVGGWVGGGGGQLGGINAIMFYVRPATFCCETQLAGWMGGEGEGDSWGASMPSCSMCALLHPF